MSLGFFMGQNKVSENKNALFEMATTSSPSVATQTTYWSTVGGLAGYLAQVDVIAWFGIGIALFTAAINWHYKRQENKRANQIHQLKLKELEGQCNVKD